MKRIFTFIVVLLLTAGVYAAVPADQPAAAEVSQSRLTAQPDDSRVWNLKEVDIRTIVHEVSDVTGKNFIISPKVSGKVTFVTSKPLNSEEVYHAFLAVLHAHGYAAVPEGNVIKIVPNSDQSHISAPISIHDGKQRSNEIVVDTIRVHNFPVTDLVKAIKPLLPKYSQIQAYKASNDIIIADHAGNIKKVREIVARLDRPTKQNLAMLPLVYANAEDLSKTLNELFTSRAAGIRNAGQQPEIKIVADVRTNSLLISGGSFDQRREMMDLVKRLDQRNKIEHEITEVFYLKYMPAETFAPIVQGVVDNYYAEKEKLTGKREDGQRNSLSSISGGSSSSSPSRSLNSQFNLLNPSSNFNSGGSLGGGSSFGSTSNVTGFESEKPRSGSLSSRVQWEQSTNSVIVTAPVDLMARVHRIMDKLDIRRPQVLIEAIIAEVSVGRAKELGVEWRESGKNQAHTRFEPTSATLSAIGTGLSGMLEAIGEGLTVGIFKNGGLHFLLRAIAGDSDSNVLATPNLLTLDNEPALIKVGRKVSFAVGEIENNPTGGNPFTSFERQDVGLILSIKPQITPDGGIRLQIQQELSNLLTSADAVRAGGNPDTTERFIQTTVMADDGQILVLGGLLQKEWERVTKKVPYLGDIPGLGALFRNKYRALRNRNLMIFLRPRIMYNSSDSEKVTHGKYEYLRQQQLHLEHAHSHPIVTPVIPPRYKHGEHLPAPFCNGDLG